MKANRQILLGYMLLWLSTGMVLAATLGMVRP
jgi:hypothetical protein